MRAPSATELLTADIVKDALESAWMDSLPEDPARRHEEGGWIYMNTATSEITVVRANAGGRAFVDLSHPPVVEGCVVVGKLHTHPNPISDGWRPGPSDADLRIDSIHGVPDLIRAEDGVHFSGPARRRGGLSGRPGFPASSK